LALGIEVFSNTVDALEKLSKLAAQATGMPGRRRGRYLAAVQEAYQLLNAATNLVILRLGDLSHQKKKDFLAGLEALDNMGEWMDIERQVRLCSGLRSTHTELDTILTRMSMMRGRDWGTMRALVDQVLNCEGTLANLISAKLSTLARRAVKAAKSPDEYKEARGAVITLRDAVIKERQRLMQAETAFLDAIAGRAAG
jgi:hypothetical protein